MPDLESASTAGFFRGARWGRDIDKGTSRADLPVGVQARAVTIALSGAATAVGDGAFFRDAEFADADEPLVETQLPPGEFRSAELRNKVAEKDETSYHGWIDLETAIAAAFADLASESEIKRRAKQAALSIAKAGIELSGKSVATAFSDATQIEAPPAELPPIPTEKYVGNRGGRAGGENIVEFLRRVWGRHIEVGLSLAELRRHDLKAVQAVTNWKSRLPWPNDLPLLSTWELKARRAAKTASNPESLELLKKARREVAALEREMGLGR